MRKGVGHWVGTQTRGGGEGVDGGMSREARKRSFLLLAILLVGFALWSISGAAQAPGGGGPSAGPAATTGGTAEEPVAAVPDRRSAHAYLRAGDEAFAAGDYAAAELEYRRAADREPSFKASYNLGVALARQGRDAEAGEAFARAQRLAPADEPDALGDAAYNAGTAAATTSELEQSIADYTEALRADPQDREAKENLAQVLRQLREQRQQQEQQQSEGEEGENSEQGDPREGAEPPPPSEDAEDAENAEDSGDEREEQPGEPRDGEQPQRPEGEGEDDPPSSEAEASAEDVAREEAERLLNLARELERETQEKLKLGERTNRSLEKDW